MARQAKMQALPAKCRQCCHNVRFYGTQKTNKMSLAGRKPSGTGKQVRGFGVVWGAKILPLATTKVISVDVFYNGVYYIVALEGQSVRCFFRIDGAASAA